MIQLDTKASPGFREEMSRPHTLLCMCSPAGRQTVQHKFLALTGMCIFHIYASGYEEVMPQHMLQLCDIQLVCLVLPLAHLY